MASIRDEAGKVADWLRNLQEPVRVVSHFDADGLCGSAIIMRLMVRFPVIVYVGAGLLAYAAGEMIASDQALRPYLPQVLHDLPYLLAIALTVAVVGSGWWHNTRKRRAAHDVPVQGEHAPPRPADKADHDDFRI